MGHKVIAECVDLRSGKRFFPGDWFLPEPEAKQEVALLKANCIEISEEDADVREPLATSLDAMKKADLESLAADRGVDISTCRTKADIISAIESAQA